MWSYLSYPAAWKPYVHVLAALAIWLFAVVLLADEQSSTIMTQLDKAHLYSLNKLPYNYTSVAWSTIQNIFTGVTTPGFPNVWVPGTDDAVGGCMSATTLSTVTGCPAKRAGIVTAVRSLTNCDLYYQSQACACQNWILRGIANDSSAVGASPNRYVGNGQLAASEATSSFTNGRNITGMSAQYLKAIESCHWLYRSSYVAAENNGQIVRRVVLFFILTTLITGNAVTYFFFRGPKTAWAVACRVLVVLVWPIVGYFVGIGLELSFAPLLSNMMITPLFILILYESLVDSDGRHDAFLHPFFFAEILPILTVMALVENEVLDFDNVLVEVLKAHAISYLYLGVTWFTVKSQGAEHNKAEMLFYSRKSQQDGLLIASMLAVLVTVNTAMAPYTYTPAPNLLWWLPSVFCLFAFVAVIWISPWDRFKDYNSAKLGADAKRPDEAMGYVKNEALYISLVLLVLTTLVAVYFWRDFSLDWHAMLENMPTRSVQVNVTWTWLNPGAF